MADRILKFGGVDPLSRTEWSRGESEPDTDPRGQQGTEIVRGMHLNSAVDQLEPAATTNMAYFDPDTNAADMSLAQIEEAVREGEMSLDDIMTKTGRFTPLVNPRRARRKHTGDFPAESDGDLWHVPTNNYSAMPPRQIFTPLASVIDENDSVENSGVYGEFRERRNGGEVFGDIWFDDFDVGAIDGDPVRLGFKFGWNYFGDRAFFYQPFAQQTQCKNSIRSLDDKQTVMHHNRKVSFREMWAEAMQTLGMYGDALSQQIQAAQEVIYDFSGEFADEDDEDTPDGLVPMPMSIEAFYEYAGFPDVRVPADHAREEARNSSDPRESSQRINAWHIHAGATYWLSWHWNGAEDSQRFREHRRTADDLLINPYQMADRVQNGYESDVRGRIIEDVLDNGQSIEEASDAQRAEIDERVMNHEGVVRMESSVGTLEDMVDRFNETEERLDRIQEAIAEQE